MSMNHNMRGHIMAPILQPTLLAVALTLGLSASAAAVPLRFENPTVAGHIDWDALAASSSRENRFSSRRWNSAS